MKKLLFLPFLFLATLLSAQGVQRYGQVDSTAYSTRTYTVAPWPAQVPLGVIYNQNQWTNQNDFTPGPSASDTVTYTNGHIQFAGPASVTYNNYYRILYQHPTQLPRFTMVITFKVHTTPAAGTVGFGLGLKTDNLHTAAGDFTCYMNTTNSGSSGYLNIVRSDGVNTYATGTSSVGNAGTVHLNDSIQMTVAYTDSLVTCSAINITQGTSTATPLTWTNTMNSTLGPVFTNCNFELMTFGPAKYEICNITITSDVPKNANAVIIGNSKMQGYDATYYSTRTGWLLNTVYPGSAYSSIWTWAGGNNQTGDMLLQEEEMTSLNAAQYLLIDPLSNDVRFATAGQPIFTTVTANLTKIVNILRGGGARVAIGLLPEDSTAGGVGLTIYNNWVKANATALGYTYIDTWDSLSTSNVLKSSLYGHGDGVHLNNAGYAKVDSVIVTSGFLSVPLVRRGFYRTVDNTAESGIKIAGDSVHTASMNKSPNFLDHCTIYGTWDNGVLQDNGSEAGAAVGPFVPMNQIQFVVNGFLGVNGAGGGFVFSNRSSANQAQGSMAMYEGSSGLLSFYSTEGSAHNVMVIDSIGHLGIGTGISGTSLPSAHLYIIPGDGTSGNTQIQLGWGAKSTTAQSSSIEADTTLNSGGDWLLTDRNGNRDSIMRSNAVRAAIAAISASGGAYVPTVTAITNAGSITVDSAFWTRSGNIVTVTGLFTATPTATASSVQLTISLPVSSHLGSQSLWGQATVNTNSNNGYGPVIAANVAGANAEVTFVNGSGTSSSAWYYSFIYIVQ